MAGRTTYFDLSVESGRLSARGTILRTEYSFTAWLNGMAPPRLERQTLAELLHAICVRLVNQVCLGAGSSQIPAIQMSMRIRPAGKTAFVKFAVNLDNHGNLTHLKVLCSGGVKHIISLQDNRLQLHDHAPDDIETKSAFVALDGPEEGVPECIRLLIWSR